MSEITFSCPVCGQPVRFNTASASSNTICQSCRRTIGVPQSALPTGTPAPFSPTAKLAPTTTSGLAVASFICSVFLCVGCIPGIICGHLAQRKIRREPGLGGGGFAIAGLVISYLSLVATAGFTLLVIACMSSPTFMKGFREGFEDAQQRRAAESSSSTDQDMSDSNNAPAAGDPLWKLDLSTAAFPDQPAAGKVHGQDFTVESATALNGNITLHDARGKPGNPSITILSAAKAGDSLAGKTLDIAPSAVVTSTDPMTRVRLVYKGPNARRPQTKYYPSGYALKLELGTADNDGKIPGKIYLCLPDNDKSYVAGTFSLETNKPSAQQKKSKKPSSN